MKFAIDNRSNTVYLAESIQGGKILSLTPWSSETKSFNPIEGTEEEVIERMVGVFTALQLDSPVFFRDMGEKLTRNAIMVLKRTKGEVVTLLDFSNLINNIDGLGVNYVEELKKLVVENDAEMKENADTVSWFIDEYFNKDLKTFEHCSMIRELTKVLLPGN